MALHSNRVIMTTPAPGTLPSLFLKLVWMEDRMSSSRTCAGPSENAPRSGP